MGAFWAQWSGWLMQDEAWQQAEDHAKKKTHACRRQAAMLAGAGHVLEVAAVAVAVVVDRPVAEPHVGGNNC